MTAEPTILIVGAGVFGASTAYHLANQYQDGSKITVVDQTEPSPDLAASTDINKIIRADYSSAFYAELAYKAMDAWAGWSELRDHYHRTGWIMLDTEDSDLADRIRKVFKLRGQDPTKDIALDELDDHWKGILQGTNLEGFGKAYWNPEAGWCDASAATASIMNAALARAVKGVSTIGGRELTADKIVLATGAWTSSLMSPVEDHLNIVEKDRVERQVSAAGVAVVQYKMSESEMDQLSDMPVVVYGEHGEVIPPPKENRLLKYTNSNTFMNTITTSSGHRISVPPNRDQHIAPARLKKEAIEAMSSQVMPNFTQAGAMEADYWRLCWDAYTPTQDWLLCKHTHPALNNLYFATGGSFHSYKFLPIIGKYMTNVLSGTGNGAEKDRA
ncbi:Putative FAD dependent oxidoreductase, FAD/NAD(P)-binding domain superfamily, MTOX family [Septoria linicola]|uniref:FAD dependent oxidoreductase, FAD/NAD(P)-binding domain superfamily, MTOX family n=1 Tax=Septoria linicola TaxID=215465 RepID=A0A9Q9AGF0_9PEZI|nr:putative FAD dependent oxidoreductase, FAD/NAD(P)-binding domain superfamily, MTOX family [Septoria linicola]USW47109.1 Putative FAD dependent oxidoreductase, FAD/NAD(P)-binding domain superfamily, MTOX family [Septoria linicola]